jgi:hypothetical protein
MKKLLVALVLAVAACLLYAFVLRSPEKRACVRMAELCGLDTRDSQVERCTRALAAMKESNASAVKQANACVADARSCAEAAGCASGAAWTLGAGLVNDFLGGLQKAVK